MPENPESEGSRLITLKQIELEHGVSRSALHTYRRSASFPQPVPVEGSTKTQYDAAEVAAWFNANPKQQGKKRDQFVSHQQGVPVTTTVVDPRVQKLAESRYRNGYGAASEDAWDQLDTSLRQHFIGEAAAWLRAAVEAGLMPPAERPTDKHMAVYLDEEDFLYGEYDGDDILRLRWVSEQAQSKRELEEQGAEFRLIGWSE